MLWILFTQEHFGHSLRKGVVDGSLLKDAHGDL